MKKPTPKLRTHDNYHLSVDSDGVQHVTAWSKAVRNAILRGAAEHQRQKAPDRAGTNWNKTFLISTDIGLRSIRQAASAGAQGDLPRKGEPSK
jgi:hypothetical protein